MFNKFLKGFFSEKANITINGKKYSGSNITIDNGQIIIDGVSQQNYSKDNVIRVSVIGDVNNIKTTSGDVDVEGNINNLQTNSGDVDVNGNVFKEINTTSGDIDVNGDITGNITTNSGDIEAHTINGTVNGTINM